MTVDLRISGEHYEQLIQHLLPGDGLEAAAVALCGRYVSRDRIVLTIHEIMLIPYEECERQPDLLTWPTRRIEPYFERIGRQDLAIVKIHSHPNGYPAFSDRDNISDLEFFNSVYGWSMNKKPHASIIMLPHGQLLGRAIFSDLHFEDLNKIVIAGDEIIHFRKRPNLLNPEFAKRIIQAFGEKTFQELQDLKIGVVGCSGTGSIVIEQLVRLGVGSLVLVDPDVVEFKNLNRITNTTVEDALAKRQKVKAIEKAINQIGLGTRIEAFAKNLYDDINTLRALVECDILFGCMDSIDGRHLLNQLASYYLIPYLDLGVKLEADGSGGIDKICGSVHYIQPGKSSLLTRGIYTMADVQASSQYRKNLEEYDALRQNAYIKNINIGRPAVISVNMQIASHAVNEMLNRIHKYRISDNSSYAASTIDISESYIVNMAEDDYPIDAYLNKVAGRGDSTPFIGIPEILL